MRRFTCLILSCLGVAVATTASQASISNPSTLGWSLPSPQVNAQSQPSSAPPSAQRMLLNRYCVTCHNERLRTASLMLDKMDIERLGDATEVWERVVAKLRSGSMPPVGQPRPDEAMAKSFMTWLEKGLDRAAATKPNPGRPAVHRLNRAEYTNATRDLLALEIDGASMLPADDSGYGFDNIADVLTVSTGLLERYLSAAHAISRRAVGDPALRPIVKTYTPAPHDRQQDRPSEDLPFGTRGGLAIRADFPLDGEYSLKIVMKRPNGQTNSIVGLHERQEIDVRLDGAHVKTFTFGGVTPASRSIPLGDPLGQFEVRFPVKAGTHVIGVAFHQATLADEGLKPRFPTQNYSFQTDAQEHPRIETVEIGGPDNVIAPGESPSRQKIFVCRPTSGRDEEACARTILSMLARRAYRRPITSEDLPPLLGFYEAGRREGSFDAGIQAALKRMLMSPQFLFRIESEPKGVAPGTAYRLSDVELASRLSFFIWSSIPDDELLDLAARGKLKEPAVLAQQVQRMLRDDRSTALVRNFGGQWLYLRNLEDVKPDTHEYPDFDDELRVGFRKETELFVESQLREDRPVIDLLRANYTFLNERLARHYGIPRVKGSHFRRITLTDANRFGLMGHGSILTVTSYANRTSPVLRGKWVLENILGAPPPAPPPNVPALEEAPGVKYRSMRDRMEQHRKSPVCAACHARIDPLGFAMENFDAVGQWRTQEGDTPIDASGALDGVKFNGLADLRKLVLNRQEAFAVAVTKKLLTYALGRGVEYYDMPAVRQITHQAAVNDYRWSSIILGIVNSSPFQMRRARP